MSLESFVHHLHFDTDKARPPDWEVDWGDAPLKVKCYRGLPVYPLSPEVPLTLKCRDELIKADSRSIGHLLWYAFGLTQMCQTSYLLDPATDEEVTIQWSRRFVPSGGALYPSELYIYLKLGDLPHGVYHYDGAHHRLNLLRKGIFDGYLDRALGHWCDVSACPGVMFVSTVFWKNYFKYNNFSYRLQSMDAGVLAGQLLEVSKRMGYETAVYFQFVDQAVNRLLGLSGREESVYAVIPLSTHSANAWLAADGVLRGLDTATELCRELSEVRHETYNRSRKMKEYPMLIQMNKASFLDSTQSFRLIRANPSLDNRSLEVALPRVKRMAYDLVEASRNRYSPEMDFVLREVSVEQLAALLHEATASFVYRNDLDGVFVEAEPRVEVYGCFYNIPGIQDGAYRYNSRTCRLQQIRSGDQRPRLQQAMSLHNVNLFQVPICLHVVGYRDYLRTALGYRGYRIAQMEAGMLTQRLLLAASGLGLGGHPLLGFDTRSCDEIYDMEPKGKTCLIQIPIGHYRPRARVQGSLHG
jgi:SagB-type dehydrogenase family enzyme